MRTVKYTDNRKYKDFLDKEIQEEIVDNLRKTKNKPVSIFKKILNKILKK